MASVLEIVTRAFRKIGVSAADEALDADQISVGVDALNMMVHAWKLEGVDLSWADQAASDTFALDSEYHEGVVYNLASRLSPDYVIPPAFDADAWFRSIQAANVEAPTVSIPTSLKRLPSQMRSGSKLPQYGF